MGLSVRQLSIRRSTWVEYWPIFIHRKASKNTWGQKGTVATQFFATFLSHKTNLALNVSKLFLVIHILLYYKLERLSQPETSAVVLNVWLSQGTIYDKFKEFLLGILSFTCKYNHMAEVSDNDKCSSLIHKMLYNI